MTSQDNRRLLNACAWVQLGGVSADRPFGRNALEDARQDAAAMGQAATLVRAVNNARALTADQWCAESGWSFGGVAARAYSTDPSEDERIAREVTWGNLHLPLWDVSLDGALVRGAMTNSRGSWVFEITGEFPGTPDKPLRRRDCRPTADLRRDVSRRVRDAGRAGDARSAQLPGIGWGTNLSPTQPCSRSQRTARRDDQSDEGNAMARRRDILRGDRPRRPHRQPRIHRNRSEPAILIDSPPPFDQTAPSMATHTGIDNWRFAPGEGPRLRRCRPRPTDHCTRPAALRTALA